RSCNATSLDRRRQKWVKTRKSQGEHIASGLPPIAAAISLLTSARAVMPLNDVIAATTVNAAMALKRLELGSLKPGSVGDATMLSIKEGRFDYVDVVGEHLEGDRKIASEGVVIAGRWWHPKEA